MPTISRRLHAVIQALFVVFLWATSYVLIKIGLADLPPLTFAGLRYAIAFSAIGLVAVRRKNRQALASLTRADWLRLAVLGLLLYTGTQGAGYLALARLPAITVNLLWSFTGVVVAFLGVGLLKEPPGRLQWAGMGLALLGAFAYFGPTQLAGAERVGVLVALVGVAMNSAAALLGRAVNRTASISPITVTFVSMGVGSIILLTSGLLTEGFPSISPVNWAIIIWLAIVNTAFAFSLWNLTLRTLSAFESSVINGTMMIWIPILAVIFLSETLQPLQLIGILLAAVGTLLVQLRGGGRGVPDTEVESPAGWRS